MSETNGQEPRSQLDRLRSVPGTRHVFGARTKARPRADLPERAGAPALPVRRGAADDVLVPVSLDAIRSVMDRMEAKYFVDGDAIGGIWDEGYFYFFLLREGDDDPVLQVHGQWERVLPADLYPQAAIFANEWNAERTWPKAYARILDDDEDSAGIYGELTVDFGPTVTVNQLDRTINAAIASSLALFDEVRLTFPEGAEIQS